MQKKNNNKMPHDKDTQSKNPFYYFSHALQFPTNNNI